MKKTIAFILIIIMSFQATSVFSEDTEINSVLYKCSEYILNTVKNPTCSSVGGEWTVLGLARSGIKISDGYFDTYYSNLCDYLNSCGGVMHRVKYTEYSRAIIAVTAIGKNPSDVSGYNLLLPLSDFDKTVKQGINGPIWALIALDSGNYAIDENVNAVNPATREKYVDYILSKQTSEGTWSLSGEGTDPDITAMALVALSKYKERQDVKDALTKAITKMSELQTSSGGYITEGTESSESSAQMLVALSELGISYTDSRFTKNGNNLLTNLLSFMLPEGSFCHTKAKKEANLMATEQAFYAVVSVNRTTKGENTLYNMSDIAKKDNLSYNESYISVVIEKLKLITEALDRAKG